MSKWPISTQCECQNRVSTVKISYFDSMRMSKQDFECQNSLFRLSANVKIAYYDSVRMSKLDFECQNSLIRLSANVKIGF